MQQGREPLAEDVRFLRFEYECSIEHDKTQVARLQPQELGFSAAGVDSENKLVL